MIPSVPPVRVYRPQPGQWEKEALAHDMGVKTGETFLQGHIITLFTI